MTPSHRIRLGGLAAVALAAACSSGPEGSATLTGGSASASASTTAGAGAGTGAGTTSNGPTAVAVSAGGGSTFVCDPPAAPGSLYERTADAFGSAEPASMCAYRGDALLIVNVAAI